MAPPRFPRSSLLFAALCVLAAPAAAGPARPDPAPAGSILLEARAAGISSYRLSNGFKIVLAPFPSAASVRIELLVKTGSKQEGYGEAGMAHLLEHMLFKSAGPRADLKSDLTALGAAWNGTTTADRTNYFETVAADPEKVDAAIRIEADRFIRAGFTREHLASEMSVVRNELDRSDSDPGSVVMRALQRQAYFWHGYGRPTIGARSDIEEAPFGALQAFHRRHYRPDNAVLLVSGRFDPERVLALAGALFTEARNPETPKAAGWTREETRALTNRSELFLPAGTTMAASAWKLPGLTDRETHAIDLAAGAICAEDWGSLRRDLVLERRIAVSVSCSTQPQADYSLLIAAAVAGKEADAETMSRALREHIEGAAAKGITGEQLERARRIELNAYERLESTHETLAPLLSQAEAAGDWRLYFWQRDVAKGLALDEVNAALRKWAVAVNRSDVLLRHADGIAAPGQSRPVEAAALVVGHDWPMVAKSADPIPGSVGELARATVHVDLDGVRARAALIPRRTQGDLAWVVLGNDYGNEAALAGRRTACAMGSSLMAYGGGGRSRDQLSASLEALQARWSMGLDGLFLEAPRRNVDAALDILLAARASPALPEDEFERIKAGAIARLEANLKDPGAVAASVASLRFDNYPPQHPLQPRSLEQQLAASRAVSLADAAACVADFSAPAHVRLAMVGDFSPEDVKAVWAKVAQLPRSRIPYERVKDLAAPTAVDTTTIKVSLPEKPNATVGGAALLRISDDAADFPALRVAVKVLGGDADSRIWKRLREREGLAYDAGASLSGSSFEPRSRLSIRASATSHRAEAALDSLRDELARALRDGLTDREVVRAKRAWAEERRNALRSERSFVGSLADGLYTGRDYAWMAKYDERIARVTAEEATLALRRYLAETPIVWTIGRGS